MALRCCRMVLALCLALPALAAEAAKPLACLMIVGGGYHDYDKLPRALADRLTRRGEMRFDIRGDVAAITPGELDRYDVLMFNDCQRPALSAAFRQCVLRRVEGGCGLVVIHCSLWSYLDWPEWTPLIGGRVETHDKYGSYDVVVLDPAHATMLGVGNRFAITDEPYLVDQRDPQATVLAETAEARHDAAGKLRPGPDPQVWVKRHGQGRIFVTTFGHDAAAQESPPFMDLMHNGIRWAGGRVEDTGHNQLTKSERQTGFELLFNGRDLEGWEGDPKAWRVEGGELVGRGENLTRDAFLVHRRTFGDFILRFSFRLLKGNSGVQIRSIAQPDDPQRPLRGYHVDLVDGKWGSLYDYGGPRKILAYDMPAEQAARAIVPRGWNDVQVRAVGREVIIHVNGIRAAQFRETDSAAPATGLIGLQVHRGSEPTDVRFRDLRVAPAR